MKFISHINKPYNIYTVTITLTLIIDRTGYRERVINPKYTWLHQFRKISALTISRPNNYIK